jgi:hypothetical protein
MSYSAWQMAYSMATITASIECPKGDAEGMKFGKSEGEFEGFKVDCFDPTGKVLSLANWIACYLKIRLLY